jgi:3-isopropylmalate dehydrogenase
MPEKKRLVILPGDGVGPEVMEQGVELLKALQEPFGLHLEFEECPIGGAALRQFGAPLPPETLKKCRAADAVLLGAVGAPGFEKNPPHLQPDHALVELRTGLQAFCGIRSVRINNVSPPNSPKSTSVKNIDFVIIRDLQEGLYFEEYAGETKENPLASAAYQEQNIQRVARKAFQLAGIRRRKVLAVDTAHKDGVSRWWRAIVRETSREFPFTIIEHQFLENCLEDLQYNPFRFDVILAEPKHGKVIIDMAQKLIGQGDTLASACLGEGVSIYQPVHRAAPEIAGKNIANPIAIIHCAAMMLQYSFHRPLAAQNIEEAIAAVEARSSLGKKIEMRELGRKVLEEVMHHLSSQPIMTA